MHRVIDRIKRKAARVAGARIMAEDRQFTYDGAGPATQVPSIHAVAEEDGESLDSTPSNNMAAHLAAAHAEVMHGDSHLWIYLLGAVVMLVVVLLLIRSICTDDDSEGKARPKNKTALPAFDVEGGSGVNGISSSNGKVLHPSVAQAAKEADVATLREWLSDERCAIDAALAATGGTALHAAAEVGHANIVRLLLDGGADALVIDAQLRTPLHLVATAGHGLCVKALLDAGADPEAKDGGGASPIALAEKSRHMGTARMMRLHLERRAAGDKASGLRRAK